MAFPAGRVRSHQSDPAEPSVEIEDQEVPPNVENCPSRHNLTSTERPVYPRLALVPRFFLDPSLYGRLPRRCRAQLVAAVNLLVAGADQDGLVLGGQEERAELLGISSRALRTIEARLERGGVLVVSRRQAGNQNLLELRPPAEWKPAEEWDLPEPVAAQDAVLTVRKFRVGGVRKPASALPSAAYRVRARVITNDKTNDLLSVPSGFCPPPPAAPRAGESVEGALRRMVELVRAATGAALGALPRLRAGLGELVGRLGLAEAFEEVERVIGYARRARNPAAYAFACLAGPGVKAAPRSAREGGGRGGPVALSDALAELFLFTDFVREPKTGRATQKDRP